MNAFRDGMFVKNALQMSMACGTPTAGAACLGDASDGHQVVLFDHGPNIRFRNIQTVAKRPFAAGMSVVQSSRKRQIHSKNPVSGIITDIETQSHFSNYSIGG